MRHVAYYLVWGLWLIALGGLLFETTALWRLQSDNRAIMQFNDGRQQSPLPTENTVPAIKLAYAVYLLKHRRYEEAQPILTRLIGSNAQAPLISHYNLGNVYLHQAIAAAENMQIDDAITLTSLAKDAYRQALALNSHYWDAKYNLEVAMRLLPEMDRINLTEDREEPKKSKPWTTLPGFPRGLP